MSIAENEKAQARLKARERRRLEQEKADLRDVLSTPAGRRFLWRLLDEVAGVSTRSYVGNPEDTFFNEGRRHVGLLLMTEAQRVSPADYVHMLGEALDSRREDELHRHEAELDSEND